MSPDRRAFIRLASRSLGVAGIVGPSGLLTACGGGDGPTDPGGGEERGPAPRTSMLFPNRQYLRSGGGLVLPFDSPEAQGEAFSWRLTTPGGAVTEATGRTFEYEFTGTGRYTVEFAAESTGWPRATETRVLDILDPLPGGPGGKAAWWARSGGGWELRVADDWRDPESFRAFGPQWGAAGQVFHGEGQSSWNADRTRLAISVQDGTRRRIAWIDVETGELELLTDSNGEAMNPAVSPSGAFIAYSDDSASIQRAAQLWVMRADGSDKVRIGGRTGDEFFAVARAIAWRPDESGILIATHVNPSGGGLGLGSAGMVRRMATVTDVFGAQPVVTPLHPDSRLDVFVRTLLATGQALTGSVIESGGLHAIAVHPNGEEVLYPIRYTVDGFPREAMVAERVDGGSIRLVSRRDGSCTVSPDGNEVWFHDLTLSNETETIFRTFQSGGPVTRLLTGARGATMVR